MRNIFIWILVFLVASILFLLAMDGTKISSSQERYDAYVNYEDIEECIDYIDFMECVVDRIDDTVSRRIYKNNIYITVRNWASYEDSEDLEQVCMTSLMWLANEKSLHKYWCKIENDEPSIQNLVLPEDLKIEPLEITDLAEWLSWTNSLSSDSWTWVLLSWNIDILSWTIAGWETNLLKQEINVLASGAVIQVITSNSWTWILTSTWVIDNPVVPYTRIQVIQNRVWFLRIRQRPSTASIELWRLWIWDVADVIGQSWRWYNIKYWENGEYSWWVSAKYVLNIWLEKVEDEVTKIIIE